MKEEAGELIGGDKQGGDGIGKNSLCSSTFATVPETS